MSAGLGHNGQLLALVERIERVTEEIKGLQDDRKDIYAEAKANGFDTKVLRKVIAARAKDAQKQAEELELCRTYAAAIGAPDLFA
jgi:uncharacterized protein (UPF0335 family)